MITEESLALAVSEWQRKHGIAENDPVIAVLELARIYLLHSSAITATPESKPPSFDDLRITIESLNSCAKSFAGRSSDIIVNLRKFSQNIERINQARWLTHFAFGTLGMVIGALFARWI